MGVPGLWSFTAQAYPQCFEQMRVYDQVIFVDGLNLISQIDISPLETFMYGAEEHLQARAEAVLSYLIQRGNRPEVCVDGTWPCSKLSEKLRRSAEEQSRVDRHPLAIREPISAINALLHACHATATEIFQVEGEADDLFAHQPPQTVLLTDDSDALVSNAVIIRVTHLLESVAANADTVVAYNPARHPHSAKWQAFCSALWSDTKPHGIVLSDQAWKNFATADVVLPCPPSTSSALRYRLFNNEMRTWILPVLTPTSTPNVFGYFEAVRDALGEKFTEYVHGNARPVYGGLTFHAPEDPLVFMASFIDFPANVLTALEHHTKYRTTWTFRKRFKHVSDVCVDHAVRGKSHCEVQEQDGFVRPYALPPMLPANVAYWWIVYCVGMFHMDLYQHSSELAVPTLKLLRPGVHFFVLVWVITHHEEWITWKL